MRQKRATTLTLKRKQGERTMRRKEKGDGVACGDRTGVKRLRKLPKG